MSAWTSTLLPMASQRSLHRRHRQVDQTRVLQPQTWSVRVRMVGLEIPDRLREPLVVLYQHHTCRALASFETTRMVTVTIHVQSYNVCCGCLFDEQLHKAWTFLQIPSETLQIGHRFVPSVSARLVPVPSSSMTDLACPVTNTPLSSPRYDNFLVCNASSCGDVVNTSSSLFLTDGVVTPFALSRFKDLTITSACRGSGSYSIQFFPPSDFQRTYRFRIRTSLAASQPAPRIARTFIV